MGREDARHRRGVHEVPTAALEHAGQHGARSVDVGHEVHLPLAVPHLVRRRDRVAAGGDAGVGIEEVDRAVRGLRLAHQATHVVLAADVAAHRESADLGRHRARRGFVDVGHHHARPARCEAPAHRPPDAAAASGDDCDLVSNLHAFLLSVRLRSSAANEDSSQPSPGGAARRRSRDRTLRVQYARASDAGVTLLLSATRTRHPPEVQRCG